MKYFIVTSTIKDSEYEYMSQSPVRAKVELDARLRIYDENEEWTKDDYREHEINGVQEVDKETYYIIKKYIY